MNDGIVLLRPPEEFKFQCFQISKFFSLKDMASYTVIAPLRLVRPLILITAFTLAAG